MVTSLSANRPKLRTDAAARYVGLGRSTLEKMRTLGGGPAYVKLGKSVVYDPNDLDSWIASNRRRSTTVAA